MIIYLSPSLSLQELFVESLALEAYHYTSQSKKKTVSRRDVDHCIDAIEALAFLDGAMDWCWTARQRNLCSSVSLVIEVIPYSSIHTW